MTRALLFLFSFFVSLAGPSLFAYGLENYDLKEITPALQKAIEDRQARYPELQRLKSAGVIGEDNQGFLRGLKEAAEAEGLVQSENQDRELIYQALLDQNQLGPEAIERVRAVFAEVQRGKARAGDFIQLRSGEWIQK